MQNAEAETQTVDVNTRTGLFSLTTEEGMIYQVTTTGNCKDAFTGVSVPSSFSSMTVNDTVIVSPLSSLAAQIYATENNWDLSLETAARLLNLSSIVDINELHKSNYVFQVTQAGSFKFIGFALLAANQALINTVSLGAAVLSGLRENGQAFITKADAFENVLQAIYETSMQTQFDFTSSESVQNVFEHAFQQSTQSRRRLFQTFSDYQSQIEAVANSAASANTILVQIQLQASTVVDKLRVSENVEEFEDLGLEDVVYLTKVSKATQGEVAQQAEALGSGDADAVDQFTNSYVTGLSSVIQNQDVSQDGILALLNDIQNSGEDENDEGQNEDLVIEDKGGLSTGAIVGIVVACVAGIGAGIGLVVFCLRKNQDASKSYKLP
eukprot:TRINITY_DN11376_c0_g1_i1.p1 TRINITY_DN11376_c0_g1~~TRINITY_DN11376_c0_g1_i1.p1  ORF type:complete len:408 (-),score=62.68 TRINITY_DN11376_c0_g1_i1:379-1524(-)